MRIIWDWLKALFSKSPGGKLGVVRKVWPTREEIVLLPVFEGLDPGDIVVVSTPKGAQRAQAELVQETVVGFDTESQPTFLKGQVSTGPHVAQFATPRRAYVFMLHDDKCREVARWLIGSEALKKVGFGLDDDLRRIPIKLKVQPKAVVDLETLFRAKGYGRGVGVKVAVAIVFRRRFIKSKKASTSNWKSRHLSDKQVHYAASDAYAAIRVFRALKIF